MTSKKNKIIFISTVISLLVIAIVCALSVGTNFQDFIRWSTEGTGAAIWVLIAAAGIWGVFYVIWQKIKKI